MVGALKGTKAHVCVQFVKLQQSLRGLCVHILCKVITCVFGVHFA